MLINRALYLCPYLDHSIKSRDSVDLSSFSDQLALNFIPHCHDSMGVWADECHALCRLATTKQYSEIYHIRSYWYQDPEETSILNCSYIYEHWENKSPPDSTHYSPGALQTLCFQTETHNQDEPLQRKKNFHLVCFTKLIMYYQIHNFNFEITYP